MAGPDKQFDEIKALGKAMDIFWEKGFSATSMRDLVKGMGINRASMYQTYGNKHALFMAAVDQYVNASLTEIKKILMEPDSPLNKLKHLFEQFLKQSLRGKKNSCFMNNSAVELGPRDPELAAKVRYFWAQFEDIFNDVLTQAVQQNELAHNTNTRQFAVLLNNTLQGLLIKTKIGIAEDILLGDLDTLFEVINNQD